MLVSKTTDRESFRFDLQNNINLNINLKKSELFNEEAERFIRIIQETAANNTMELTHITKVVHYPLEIRDLVKVKIKARRKFYRTRETS